MGKTTVLDKIISTDSSIGYVLMDGRKVVKNVYVTTVAETSTGKQIKGYGSSWAHPDDLDLATEKVGTKIALLRSYINILNQACEHGELKEDEMDSAKQMAKELTAEVDAYINRKEALYKRIRDNREGKKEKVRHVLLSEDGKKAIEL